MSRICMRPGCDRDAAARLTYDPIGCEVWLDDLAVRVGRNQEICVLHAERLTVPRGWMLSDRRSDEPPLFAPPDVEAPALADPSPPPRRRRRRSTGAEHPANQTLELFEVLRQELAQADAAATPEAEVVQPEAEVVQPEAELVQPEAELVQPEAELVQPEAVPAPEPIVERESEPIADAEPEPDPHELPASLKATSPLLSRAFAATGHQRSVLTQSSPSEPDPDAD